MPFGIATRHGHPAVPDDQPRFRPGLPSSRSRPSRAVWAESRRRPKSHLRPRALHRRWASRFAGSLSESVAAAERCCLTKRRIDDLALPFQPAGKVAPGCHRPCSGQPFTQSRPVRGRCLAICRIYVNLVDPRFGNGDCSGRLRHVPGNAAVGLRNGAWRPAADHRCIWQRKP